MRKSPLRNSIFASPPSTGRRSNSFIAKGPDLPVPQRHGSTARGQRRRSSRVNAQALLQETNSPSGKGPATCAAAGFGVVGRANSSVFSRRSLRTQDGSVQVLVRDNNVDQALKALKKKMQREGIFREMKLRGHYEKPSEKRAREKAEAVRRARKLARKKLQREGLLPMKPKPVGAAIRRAANSRRIDQAPLKLRIDEPGKTSCGWPRIWSRVGFCLRRVARPWLDSPIMGQAAARGGGGDRHHGSRRAAKPRRHRPGRGARSTDNRSPNSTAVNIASLSEVIRAQSVDAEGLQHPRRRLRPGRPVFQRRSPTSRRPSSSSRNSPRPTPIVRSPPPNQEGRRPAPTSTERSKSIPNMRRLISVAATCCAPRAIIEARCRSQPGHPPQSRRRAGLSCARADLSETGRNACRR